MPVVLITAPWPVHYSLSNGVLPPMQYESGELYQVPAYVARGMLCRNWARVVDKEEIDSILKEREKPPAVEPPPIEPKGQADGTSANVA